MRNRLSTTCLKWESYLAFALYGSPQTTIKSKFPWFLLHQLSQHPFWCILNIKWGYLITILWWAHPTTWFLHYMGSVISTSRVRSPTRETLSFAYAEVNIISHQPTHFLWYAWALQVCKSYVQANFTDGDRWYTRWGSLILKSLSPQQYHFYYNIVDLVVFLHGVNTSDLSEFNLVERRMAPISHEIAGVLLRQYSFGNHLDSSGKTADCELEKNFLKTAWVHTELWPKITK